MKISQFAMWEILKQSVDVSKMRNSKIDQDGYTIFFDYDGHRFFVDLALLSGEWVVDEWVKTDLSKELEARLYNNYRNQP